MKQPPSESSDRAGMCRKLRSLGITPTAQRITIASLLLAKPQHLTADQVLALANAGGRLVSKATVYNTLGLFARRGLVRELAVACERTFYDTNTAPHGHYYDPETRQLSDFADDELQRRLPQKLPPDKQIDRIDVIVYLRNPKKE